jgi:hypothetical protein
MRPLNTFDPQAKRNYVAYNQTLKALYLEVEAILRRYDATHEDLLEMVEMYSSTELPAATESTN